MILLVTIEANNFNFLIFNWLYLLYTLNMCPKKLMKFKKFVYWFLFCQKREINLGERISPLKSERVIKGG